ncbi:MAG: hypothetical protein NTY38_28065 [Acidobacteria bacterium]|nr:hypothetical protein [Acidobacteriota bacterium]
MWTILTLGLAAAVPALLSAQTVEFSRDIRPILSDKCFTCHGPDATHRKANLRFDIEGGADQVIVPGDPARSRIVRRITSASKALRMPPAYAGKEKLSDPEIETVRRWIQQGAKWKAFWSFVPPQRPAVPAVKNRERVRNPIDSFIISRLEREACRLPRKLHRQHCCAA